MEPRDTTARRLIVLAPARQRPLRAARELWWRPKRQRIAQLDRTDRRHPLDEGYVVDAMARQIEEIRNLPEVVR